MPRETSVVKTAAELNAANPFLILESPTTARHASFDEALSLAQRGHEENPNTTYVVARIVATIEPIVTSKITHHR